MAPSSSTSARIFFSMAISPSVARSSTVSFTAEILMHSKIGFVVLVLHALTTFMTASDSSIPSQMIFMLFFLPG